MYKLDELKMEGKILKLPTPQKINKDLYFFINFFDYLF